MCFFLTPNQSLAQVVKVLRPLRGALRATLTTCAKQTLGVRKKREGS